MSDEWKMPDGPFTGGCQCGAVRFRAEALVDNPHVCYCRMCQKATGNLSRPLVGVRHENQPDARKPTRFRSSATVDRGFCSNCGTPLFYQYLPGGQSASRSVRSTSLTGSNCAGRWEMRASTHPSGISDAVESFGTNERKKTQRRSKAIRASNNQHPDHDTTEWTPRKYRG